jgi:hypothetical protein
LEEVEFKMSCSCDILKITQHSVFTWEGYA